MPLTPPGSKPRRVSGDKLVPWRWMLVWGIYLTHIDSRLMTGPLFHEKQKRSGTNKQIDKINKIITRSVKLYSTSTFQVNEKKHVREITARQDNGPNWTVLVGERWSKVENITMMFHTGDFKFVVNKIK